MSESPVVIDSGIAVFRVLNTPFRPVAAALWDRFVRDAIPLYAPRLWLNEVTSVVRRYEFDHLLTAGEAEDVLRVLFDLDVSLVDEDQEACLEALRWAMRLGQRSAYGAFYLALAHKLDAAFWTADRRLCNNARQAGINWVHFMGEIGEH